MTAQIGDIVRHGEQSYTCLRQMGGELFRPQDYGMIPVGFNTACRRGYTCTYEVADSVLTLQKLRICDGYCQYPPINGVGIAGELPAGPFASEDEEIAARLARSRPQEYRDIGLRIPFSGKLLLGADFDFHYYMHRGLQRPLGFGKLFTYAFEDGVLQEITDHSQAAALLRELCGDDSDSLFCRKREPYEKLPEEIRKTLWWI